MLKPTSMTLTRISGSEKNLQKTVEALYSMQLVHVLKYAQDDDAFSTGDPEENATQCSEELLKARAIITHFGMKGKEEKVSSMQTEKLEKIYAHMTTLIREIDELKNREKDALNTLNDLEPLRGMGLRLRDFRGYESIAIFVGTVGKPIEKALAKITTKYELRQGKKAFALFVEKDKEAEVQKMLQKHGFAPINVPEKKASAEEIRLIGEELREKEVKLEARKKHSAFVLGYEKFLTAQCEKAEAPLMLAVGENSFVLDGWVPTKKFSELCEKLHGSVYVEAFKEKNGAPVHLKNPKVIEPFEFFMNLYSLPKYLEVDPSAIMFITFPLFFGFMLGDIGYGLITLLLFYGLSRMVKGEVKALLNVLMIASLATILFGFVFGEFFGLQVIEHPILHRLHDLNTMLMISVFVGFLHLNLGLFIGFLNVKKEHGLKEAVFEKLSWFVIEAGAAITAVNVMGMFTFEYGTIVGGALILAGIVMLYKGEGIQGLIELPALLSNTLSYARLFAVGLASVSLALIVNQMAGQLIAGGDILFILMGIVVLVIGHVLNIMLGILGPFLHAMRLHYVEFFSKFFTGGGEPYNPFGQAGV